MEFYMDRNELLKYKAYLEDRACRIRNRKLKYMDLGDGICEVGEEEVLASLIHLVRWIDGAKGHGIHRVTIDLGKE
jgi:hypothetical protein